MARFRLAHFSDIHYTLSPLSDVRESLRGKRAAGWLSYYLGGRGRRFARSPERIAALLADVTAQGADHTICTGDLTQVSREDEFAGLARVFGERLVQRERFTVIPGNHDRYVPEAVRARFFEDHFAALCPGVAEGFPFAKRVGPLRIVGLDPCRPTAVADASGLVGAEQRARLQALLEADTQTPTVVALHYGLLRPSGKPDTPHHRMQDFAAVQAILDASGARIVLIVHGHMHRAFTVPTVKRTIICAGSATDLHVPCGYFLYDFDDAGDLRVQRRQWQGDRYVDVDSSAFNRAIVARVGAVL